MIIDETRLSFPKKNRLLNPQDFQQVFRKGGKQNSTILTFVVHKNVLGYPRLGLAIAKRHVKRAVHRNYIRRIIREGFRHQQTLLGSVDIVVFLKRPLQESDNAVLQDELQKQWQRMCSRSKKHC